MVFLLVLPLNAASIEINEVMYNPSTVQGGESFSEWIEFYNNGAEAINLSGTSLCGNNIMRGYIDNSDAVTYRNTSFLLPAFGYAILTDGGTGTKVYNNFNVSHFALALHVNTSSLCGGLSNEGDALILTNTIGTIIYNLTYADIALEGYSIEQNFEQEWGESKAAGGTPGTENSIFNVSFHDLTLAISEVMPNPWENDDWPAPDGEWIELFNYGEREIYAGGLKITDTDGENELFIAESSIAGDIFVLPGEYLVVYRDGDSDFSLNNNGYEEVHLVQEGEESDILIDFMSYTGTTEGMSWSNVEGEWYLTSPTPMEDNEYTGECIWGLFIDTNNSIYRQEDFSFGITVDRFAGLVDEITVRGQIEDEHGEIIRMYAPWSKVTVTSDRREQYSPNLPVGVYQVSFWFENPPCLDIDPAAYRVTKLIAISPSYQRFSPTIAINELSLGSDNSVKWGQQFTAKVTIYTGNVTRSTVEFWADKNGKIISPKTKVDAEEQFKEYSVAIPLQLIPNCDNDIGDGTAVLKAAGLGVSAQQEFQIKGVDKNICTDYLDYVEEEEEKQKAKLAYSITKVPTSVAPGNAFEVTAKIDNENKKHAFKIWAYVYRGNKCYSCGERADEKDTDAEEFTLDGKEEREIELLLKLDEEMEEGEYKMKVVFNKDNQKTNKEVVKSLYVLIPTEKKEINYSLSAFGEDAGEKTTSPSFFRSHRTGAASGIVVYESNAEKSKKLIPYLLLVAGVLMVVVRWRNP